MHTYNNTGHWHILLGYLHPSSRCSTKINQNTRFLKEAEFAIELNELEGCSRSVTWKFYPINNISRRSHSIISSYLSLLLIDSIYLSAVFQLYSFCPFWCRVLTQHTWGDNIILLALTSHQREVATKRLKFICVFVGNFILFTSTKTSWRQKKSSKFVLLNIISSYYIFIVISCQFLAV